MDSINMLTPKSTRRMLLSATGAVLASQLPAPAVFAQTRKISLVFGQTPIDITDCAISSIPIGAGLFAEEGLDVDVQQISGGVAAANLLAAGRAEFTCHSTAGLFDAVDKGIPMNAFICQWPNNFFSLAFVQDSPIQTVQQLKGKTIGVPSLSGSTILFLKALLQRAGLDPEVDVSYLAVGGGYPALDAVQRDRVDALFLWDLPYARFVAMGARLRFLKPDPLPALGFTASTNVATGLIEKDPALVAAMGRALARSVIFMAAVEPAELVKLHWKVYPANKATSSDTEQDIRIETAILKARLGYMRISERVFSREEKIGDETDERILAVRDLLLQGEVVKQSLPVSAYMTRQFIPGINQVDVRATVDRARKFRA